MANKQPDSRAAPEEDETQDSTARTMSVSFDPESQTRHRTSDNRPSAGQQNMGRRRSSFADTMHAFRTAGGPNSIDAFARSLQRAAGFYEVAPVRRSFMYVDGDEDEAEYERGEIDTSPMTQRSLLREQLEREGGAVPAQDEVIDTTSPSAASGALSREPSHTERTPLIRERPTRVRGDSIFQIEPQLASPFGGSYGTTWGSSLASRVNEPAMRHAGRLFQQDILEGEADKEREPLLVRQMKENDGTVVNVVIGQSTLPQTIFNSINVLVGVGLLALPLAMRYAGWVPGLVFLTLSAIMTSYTAKLLAKCADMDTSIITFADIAYVSFGRRKIAKHIISGLFCIELLGACVAMVILFADSLDALIPQYGVLSWKIFCGAILIPLNFVPFRWLSYSSVLGIVCCVSIVAAVIADGIYKPTSPGSLREPAKTYIWPENWAAVPIAIGILMSPWGGHGVFPSIYRDMRHPFRYRTGVNITYVFTFLLILIMAVVGLLMFGDDVKDEVTKNIVSSKDYPHWISIGVIILIAIVPITKVPLSARPVTDTVEIAFGLDTTAMANAESLNGISGFWRGIAIICARVGFTLLFVGIAILLPEFDRIMSLLGAVACFTICIILPCSFHLSLFWKELSLWHRAMDLTIIGVASVLSLVSTAFNLVPQEKLRL